jgi:hypothetical protein
LARKAKEPLEPLDLADGSVDFITASMLISQFEAEPYRYFSNLACETLGAPSAAEEKRLNGSMEALRSYLLTTQIDRLGQEIHRLLAPNGRC